MSNTQTVKPQLLILAAGLGSRYGGVKQMDTVGRNGEAIIDYSVFDAIRSGFGKVVFVVSKAIEKDFRDIYSQRLRGKIDFDFAVQDVSNIPQGIKTHPERVKPWGTGHAIWCAKDKITAPFASVNADDFYGVKAFELMGKFLSTEARADLHGMVGYYLKDSLSEFGTVSRGICSIDDNQLLTAVTEHTKIEAKGDKIISYFEDSEQEIDPLSLTSMNYWGFHPGLFEQLDALLVDFLDKDGMDLKSEFYIPGVVHHLLEKQMIKMKVLSGAGSTFGMTYKEERAYTAQRIDTLIEEGVYPKALW
ncbi:MAG: nucleotidyltransferase [Cyclobacteriaceae bacterium]|nr:nucleotidyltransferase [Cyclobacteriaceae bacterium]